ncbi:MAG: hypothetical protein K940chlam6_00128 [Chlamydiae bacterium]|nr:hypothetical protein [Chlamydiota bacterium]
MHGGTSKGPVTKAGKELSRLAVLRHGGNTKESLANQKNIMKLIRQSKNVLCFFNS